MGETLLFCVVFLSQILWISVFIPMRAWSRGKYMLENCPPSTHPKFYVKPVEWHIRVLRTFMGLNLAIVVAGLAIIVALILAKLGGQWDGSIVTPWSTSGEWDAAIVTPFFALQLVPMFYISFSQQAHNKAMAKVPPPAVRTAELRRRRVIDFVPPAMLAASALTYVAFVAFVLYYRRFEFAWFSPWTNIAMVTALYVTFASSIVMALRGRNPDRHQPQKKRLDALKFAVRFLTLASIGLPALVATNLIIKLVLGPETAEPVVASLYCQLAGLIVLLPSYLARKVNKVDFDAYRQDAQPT